MSVFPVFSLLLLTNCLSTTHTGSSTEMEPFLAKNIHEVVIIDAI